MRFLLKLKSLLIGKPLPVIHIKKERGRSLVFRHSPSSFGLALNYIPKPTAGELVGVAV